MNDRRDSFALVTGASSGIGRDLARLLAADGYSLVLVARNEAALELIAAALRQSGVTVRVIVKDLSDPASAPDLVAELTDRGIAIDILINNAGFGTHGPFADADVSQQMAMIQVNIATLTHLTRLLLPGMIKSGRGRIMNVASVAGFLPGPLMAVYYASKAYVLSFSEALSSELRHKGITVTAVCPGPTGTDFFNRANVRNSKLTTISMMSSERVAKIGYDAMMAGRRLSVTGLNNRLLTVATRLLPRALVLKAAKRVNSAR
ncbi:MAG TPA: SDR family oxidoreductase [Tepidisphaeraceae bacterium]|nr:SDR family oxidoreductase [Tepidisphaeraceae bacterium]